ncbi:MAG: hypothetical protein EA361_05500 [Bacteroidetes bacterium]|nr:MAG: hypothetical protein EA361_05500 [Bacteroidota bacterium]
MKVRKLIAFAYLLVIIALAVFPFSSAGVSGLNTVHVVSFRLDHVLHLLAFVPLYPLVVWAWKPQTLRKHILWLMAGLIIAALAEYVQYFIAYRSWNPADLMANVGGVLVGVVLMGFYHWGKRYF